MNRASAFLFLLIAALPACAATDSQALQAAELDTEVTLAPGQTAEWKDHGVQVQFVAVVEDSRCPRDTTCVWAGEVKVQLSISTGSAKAMQREVLEGANTVVDGYRVTVVRVRPEPVSERKIPPGDYRVTLKMSSDRRASSWNERKRERLQRKRVLGFLS